MNAPQTYTYSIEGTGADSHTWQVEGTIPNVSPGGFMDCFQKAMLAAFSQLTAGKATYGKPGVGCRGPYKITRVLLQERT
jgi:hypothetical protein